MENKSVFRLRYAKEIDRLNELISYSSISLQAHKCVLWRRAWSWRCYSFIYLCSYFLWVVNFLETTPICVTTSEIQRSFTSSGIKFIFLYCTSWKRNSKFSIVASLKRIRINIYQTNIQFTVKNLSSPFFRLEEFLSIRIKNWKIEQNIIFVAPQKQYAFVWIINAFRAGCQQCHTNVQLRIQPHTDSKRYASKFCFNNNLWYFVAYI